MSVRGLLGPRSVAQEELLDFEERLRNIQKIAGSSRNFSHYRKVKECNDHPRRCKAQIV